jgi:hypothetical protein
MGKYSQVTRNYQDEKLLISLISFLGKWGKIPSCQSEKWGNGKVLFLGKNYRNLISKINWMKQWE